MLQIDAVTPGRAEAALATFADATQSGGDARFGTTPGELLAHIGDVDAALASLERAGDVEPTGPLAARAFEMAARLTHDAEEASRWLDRALARAPRSANARWLRIRRRIELGRVEDALADVEHLDAQAHGSRAKYAVWLNAGHIWRGAGLGPRAGEIFERALRHAPDDVSALAGLGAALLGEGHRERGVALLTRAAQLASERATLPDASVIIDLARALAEHLDDLPAAIARAASVSTDAPQAMVARGLEGRWRAALGDAAGAALAFARLRELASSLVASSNDTHRSSIEDAALSEVAAFLAEAATFHERRMGDLFGAQRYLAVALRLRAHDPTLRRTYRAIGGRIARGERPGVPETGPEIEGEAEEGGVFSGTEEGSAVHATAPPANPGPAPKEHNPLSFDLALPLDTPTDKEDVVAEARVEELTRRLQAGPPEDEVADELASLLERLGRGHELLALMIGRLEDATPEHRSLLAPRARAVLERLAAQAEVAGRHEEAALYRTALETLPA